MMVSGETNEIFTFGEYEIMCIVHIMKFSAAQKVK